MKSMKKLVLAGLILLASVVVLAGCKNDSVPEVTPAKLVSITVTPPTRTVYSVDEPFDGSDMVVTATYEDGETREVTGWTTNFSDVTSEKGVNKKVTVSYTEGDNKVTATFTVDVASYQFTETVQNYEYREGKTGTASATSIPEVKNPIYKKFGDWPQTIKGEGVDIGSGTLTRGGLIYQVGSDGNYYVKVTANPYKDTYKYSDETVVTKDTEVYFKVEPIIWRVLTESYNSTGKALLLAENILTGRIKWANSKNNYMESNIRKWLNGNSGSGEQSDYNGAAGFLQTAFTPEAQGVITPTTVKNDQESTFGGGETVQDNPYTCENTTDKIFLLSEQEATMSDYGFAEYNASGEDNTRIRVTTDYAKATGAYQDSTAGYGGWWWLRSPYYDYENRARIIGNDGNADSSLSVYNVGVGVVPALSISLQ